MYGMVTPTWPSITFISIIISWELDAVFTTHVIVNTVAVLKVISFRVYAAMGKYI